MALIDNLIAYWKLDEASGNALDAHSTHHLTDTNTVGAGTGKVGGARDFEVGSSEFFSIADNADLSVGDIDFTFAAWVNLESAGADRRVLGQWRASGSQFSTQLRFLNSNGQMLFTVSNNGTSSINVFAANFGTVPTATWCHVVCWHDSVNNVIGISVNAGTPNTAAHTTGVLDSTAAFQIGACDGLIHWDGLIDEVGFWKRVLTSQERTDLYNSGNGLAYPFSGGGAQTLEPPLIASTETLYAPTLTPGAVSLSPPLIASAEQVFAPTLSPGAVVVEPPLIVSASQVFAPTLTAGDQLAPPRIESTVQVFAPTITTGAVSISPPLIGSTSALFAPSVTPGAVSLAPPLVGSAEQLFGPTLTVGSVSLLVPLLASTTVLYAPTLSGSGVASAAVSATASDAAYVGATASDSEG